MGRVAELGSLGRFARIAVMKRKAIIAGCLALLFFAGVIVWLLVGSPARPGAEIPVTLLGYTNDSSGLLTARYADSNIAHRGYAIFQIDNPTRRDFFCYIGPVFFSDGQIDLRKSQSGDFGFPPGESVKFAVPVPDTKKPWRCGVVLCHVGHPTRWRAALMRLVERCGLDRPERSWFAVSTEISQ